MYIICTIYKYYLILYGWLFVDVMEWVCYPLRVVVEIPWGGHRLGSSAARARPLAQDRAPGHRRVSAASPVRSAACPNRSDDIFTAASAARAIAFATVACLLLRAAEKRGLY